MKKNFSLVISLFLLSFLSIGQNQNSKNENLFEQFLGTKDITIAHSIINTNDGVYSLFCQAFMEENVPKQIELYSNFIQKNTTLGLSKAYLYRGVANFFMGKENLAYIDYNRAISLNVKDAEAYFYRANYFEYLQNYKLALKDCNSALELKIQDEESVYYLRGLIYFSLGEFDKSLVDHNRVIEINKNDHNSYTTRGLVYLEMEDYKKALSDFKTAKKLTSTNAANLNYFIKMTNAYVKAPEIIDTIIFNQIIMIEDDGVTASVETTIEYMGDFFEVTSENINQKFILSELRNEGYSFKQIDKETIRFFSDDNKIHFQSIISFTEVDFVKFEKKMENFNITYKPKLILFGSPIDISSKRISEYFVSFGIYSGLEFVDYSYNNKDKTEITENTNGKVFQTSYPKNAPLYHLKYKMFNLNYDLIKNEFQNILDTIYISREDDFSIQLMDEDTLTKTWVDFYWNYHFGLRENLVNNYYKYYSEPIADRYAENVIDAVFEINHSETTNHSDLVVVYNNYSNSTVNKFSVDFSNGKKYQKLRFIVTDYLDTIYSRWNYLTIDDTLEATIVDYLPKYYDCFNCEASMSICKIDDSGEYVRVIDLSDEGYMEKGEKVFIVPSIVISYNAESFPILPSLYKKIGNYQSIDANILLYKTKDTTYGKLLPKD